MECFLPFWCVRRVPCLNEWKFLICLVVGGGSLIFRSRSILF